LLAWTGIDESAWPVMDGVDLTPLLTQPAVDAAPYAYCEATNMQNYSFGGWTATKTDKQYCVMDRRWKLIYHQLRPLESELYDLASDPEESRNLYATEIAVRDRLLAELMARDPMLDDIPGVEHADPELIKRLKSLGYVQ